MFKWLKELKQTKRHNIDTCNAMYVKGVEGKDIHTFSILLKFLKAETQGFSTIPSNAECDLI